MTIVSKKSKMEVINQKQFNELLAVRLGVTFSEAEKLTTQFKQLIYDLLHEGKRVKLQGFGKFMVSHRAARGGVNPRNPSQKITIPELNTPKFMAGDAMKEAVRIK